MRSAHILLGTLKVTCASFLPFVSMISFVIMGHLSASLNMRAQTRSLCQIGRAWHRLQLVHDIALDYRLFGLGGTLNHPGLVSVEVQLLALRCGWIPYSPLPVHHHLQVGLLAVRAERNFLHGVNFVEK